LTDLRAWEEYTGKAGEEAIRAETSVFLKNYS
jgi:hypothetical protein